jgi:hypothetical protein
MPWPLFLSLLLSWTSKETCYRENAVMSELTGEILVARRKIGSRVSHTKEHLRTSEAGSGSLLEPDEGPRNVGAATPSDMTCTKLSPPQQPDPDITSE